MKNLIYSLKSSIIIAILNWAVKRKYIPSNHAAGYEKPKRDDAILRPPNESEIAGHRDINLTIKQYEHITTEVKRETINSIKEIGA